MGMLPLDQLTELVDGVASVDDLMTAMVGLCTTLGAQFFAITHHVDVARETYPMRLHNYPDQWADFYDLNALGLSDPVHRASHKTSVGFRWSRMPEMIPLTAGDLRVLALGREQGIGDGFTVPANVPGDARGSCSFANQAGSWLADEMLPAAQLVGAFAFESARRLWRVRPFESGQAPVLTDRQRDCVLLAARGKTDGEIAQLLAVSAETVAVHIKNACERYGVYKRSSLMIRTLFDGTFTFSDIFRR